MAGAAPWAATLSTGATSISKLQPVPHTYLYLYIDTYIYIHSIIYIRLLVSAVAQVLTEDGLVGEHGLHWRLSSTKSTWREGNGSPWFPVYLGRALLLLVSRSYSPSYRA